MEKLTTFQGNDLWRLFELAKELHKSKFFSLFLTESQYSVFTYILSKNDFKIWSDFIEGNCTLKIVQSEEDNIEESKKGPTGEQLFEEGFEALRSLSLHIRFLLWERAIDFYFSSQTLDQTLNTIEEVKDDYELIDRIHNFKAADDVKDDSKQAKTEVRDEDDDYDDDDDDDNDDGGDNNAKANSPSSNEVKDIEMNDNEQDTRNSYAYDSKNRLIISIPQSALQEKLDDQDSKNKELPSSSMSTPQTQSKSAMTNSNSSFSQTPSMSGQAVVPSLSVNSGTVNISNVEDQERLIIEFNKVYHNFEYDRETLIKRRKLEESDKQLEEHNDAPANGNTNQLSKQDQSQLGINLGAASHSLKHLLKTIQNQRDDVNLTDFELRTLFMDVRKNRGKWANDDRVGQEELYEACEKVVMDLRGYTEHSTPFLNKVSKREAPNYGLIIKKPMDLNTVTKKLKNLHYNSKKEFVDDIMLIWSNCLTYNADPKHFLRAHALAMQKRTLKLIPSIPDITIRSRAEVEKEEEENEVKTNSITPGKSSKKGRKRINQDSKEDSKIIKKEKSETVAVEEVSESDNMSSNTPANNNETTSNPGSTTSLQGCVNKTTDSTLGSKILETDQHEEEDEEDDENENKISNGHDENGDENDFELQAWKTMTAKSRANYCAKRSELFNENHKLNPEAVALLRRSSGMNTFKHYLTNQQVLSKSSNLLENDELYLLEYDIMGGLPGLRFSGDNEELDEIKEQKLVDFYLQKFDGDASKMKSSFILQSDSGLNKVYTNIITKIQEIRKICFKISLIRQMQTQQFIHHTQMKPPEIEHIKEVDVDPASRLPNREQFSPEIQYAVLKRAVSKIAMQTGFETTEPFAINTLTQLAEKYFSNLARTLKLHMETNSSNKMNFKEALLASLLENGVNKPDELYTFVVERVIKQEDKLNDLKLKLSNFLKELLRPGLENFSEQSFSDNSEQFMTGDFSSDLGDDFFGFRELGLDKEYKMLSSSIPIYLLHSRLHNNFSVHGGSSKKNKYEDLLEMEEPKLNAKDLEKQIGILQPFFNKLLDKSKAHYIKTQKKKGESTAFPSDGKILLIEDEELPQKQRNIRPRLPPTGKIVSVKKKIIANSYILPDEPDVSLSKVSENNDMRDLNDLKNMNELNDMNDLKSESIED